MTPGNPARQEEEAWPAQGGGVSGGCVSSAIYWECAGPRAARLIAAKPCYSIPARLSFKKHLGLSPERFTLRSQEWGCHRKQGNLRNPFSSQGAEDMPGVGGCRRRKRAHFPLRSASGGYSDQRGHNYDASCLNSLAVGWKSHREAEPQESGAADDFWTVEAPDSRCLGFLTCKVRTAAVALPTSQATDKGLT